LLASSPTNDLRLNLLPAIERPLTSKQGKRLFIKDITYYLVPPEGIPAQIAPSVSFKKRGIGTSRPVTPKEDGANGANGTNGTDSPSSGSPPRSPPFPYYHMEPDNPTVVPRGLLDQFQWTFLIRDPHSSIPSWYRCTIPPLDDVTGFHDFYENEAGYLELRKMFDFLRATGQVGPKISGRDQEANGIGGAVKPKDNNIDICLVDADDLLDNPAGIVEGFCKAVGLDYSPRMLNWDNEEDQRIAEDAFEKWKGFHEDALESKDLKPRKHVSILFCLSASGVLIDSRRKLPRPKSNGMQSGRRSTARKRLSSSAEWLMPIWITTCT
jgi:hypothetical protein